MDKKENNKRRLFILGAGFSKPAGLPLGNELLQEIEKYLNISITGPYAEE